MPTAISIDLVALTVSIAGVFVAVLGIMSAARPPKRHMRIITSHPTRLIPFRKEAPKLGITIEGQHLEDPYIVEVRCKSTGRFDFTKANSTDGKPIEVHFDGATIRVYSCPPDTIHTYSNDANYGWVGIDPHELTRRQKSVFWVVTEGKPRVTLQADNLRDATARLHRSFWYMSSS